MRFNKYDVWVDYSASAGEVSPGVDVSKVNSIGVYVNVSAATDIQLLVKIDDKFAVYDTLSFTGAGYNFWNIWNFPFEAIAFRTTNAAKITIRVFVKT